MSESETMMRAGLQAMTRKSVALRQYFTRFYAGNLIDEAVLESAINAEFSTASVRPDPPRKGAKWGSALNLWPSASVSAAWQTGLR
jgi:hypothetical protein